jgi:hypothetical protein
MRLREPFQGVKLASGHLLLHLGLLYGNWFIVDQNTRTVLDDESIENFINPKTGYSITYNFELCRRTHIMCIIS